MDMQRFQRISTGRLSLRPMHEADPGALVAALNDWQVLRWLSRAPFPYTRADATTFQAQAQERDLPVWAIFDEAGLVGGVGLDGHLGYWLARPAWGHGYAQEAAAAVLTAHFHDPGAGAVEAAYFRGNHASARILHRLGFVETGPVREYSRAHDGEVEGVGLRLTRARWTEARAAPVPRRA